MLHYNSEQHFLSFSFHNSSHYQVTNINKTGYMQVNTSTYIHKYVQNIHIIKDMIIITTSHIMNKFLSKRKTAPFTKATGFCSRFNDLLKYT